MSGAVLDVDRRWMGAALEAADTVRRSTRPNPWVGAVVVTAGGHHAVGATQPPGGPHAEIVALARVGGDARGATLYTTLEPCDHQGRTGPCTEAIIAAGVARVVVGVEDPDDAVAGRGVARLRDAGLDVTVGVAADEVTAQLRSYLHQRRHGRPFVTLKLAGTLDGRTAAADGSSRWITGAAARADVHRLRAECDGILVGAGTVRADDPALTVRHVDGPDPRRYVLGTAPEGAAVHPCTEVTGPLEDVLQRIGGDGVIDLLVEGGARVAGALHRAGLVDRYVLYLAPALMGGDDGAPLLAGPGAATIDQIARGRFGEVVTLGADLRIELLVDGPDADRGP